MKPPHLITQNETKRDGCEFPYIPSYTPFIRGDVRVDGITLRCDAMRSQQMNSVSAFEHRCVVARKVHQRVMVMVMVVDAGLAAWDHVPRALAAAWCEGMRETSVRGRDGDELCEAAFWHSWMMAR